MLFCRGGSRTARCKHSGLMPTTARLYRRTQFALLGCTTTLASVSLAGQARLILLSQNTTLSLCLPARVFACGKTIQSLRYPRKRPFAHSRHLRCRTWQTAMGEHSSPLRVSFRRRKPRNLCSENISKVTALLLLPTQRSLTAFRDDNTLVLRLCYFVGAVHEPPVAVWAKLFYIPARHTSWHTMVTYKHQYRYSVHPANTTVHFAQNCKGERLYLSVVLPKYYKPKIDL